MYDVRTATVADLDDVIELVARLQPEPAHHIAFHGETLDEIAEELGCAGTRLGVRRGRRRRLERAPARRAVRRGRPGAAACLPLRPVRRRAGQTPGRRPAVAGDRRRDARPRPRAAAHGRGRDPGAVRPPREPPARRLRRPPRRAGAHHHPFVHADRGAAAQPARPGARTRPWTSGWSRCPATRRSATPWSGCTTGVSRTRPRPGTSSSPATGTPWSCCPASAACSATRPGSHRPRSTTSRWSGSSRTPARAVSAGRSSAGWSASSRTGRAPAGARRALIRHGNDASARMFTKLGFELSSEFVNYQADLGAAAAHRPAV